MSIIEVAAASTALVYFDTAAKEFAYTRVHLMALLKNWKLPQQQMLQTPKACQGCTSQLAAC